MKPTPECPIWDFDIIEKSKHEIRIRMIKKGSHSTSARVVRYKSSHTSHRTLSVIVLLYLRYTLDHNIWVERTTTRLNNGNSLFFETLFLSILSYIVNLVFVRAFSISTKNLFQSILYCT
jgi:hypothetical protein